MMSNALAKWQGISLILRIIIGMIIGIAFALSVPGNTVLPIFGKVFVGLLKGIAPILVFVLVISALANASGNIGGRFKNVIFIYIFGTFFVSGKWK